MKNLKTFLSLSQLSDLKNTFHGMFCVKAGRGLFSWFNRINYIILGKNSPSITRSVFVMFSIFYRLYKRNGVKFLVLNLKTWHVQVMQSVAGNPVSDTSLIAKIRTSKTKGGLPRVIPKLHRQMIRDKNIQIIRIYLSLFSLYRVLTYPSVTSLKTIIEPGVVISSDFRKLWLDTTKKYLDRSGWEPSTFRKSLVPVKPFLISKGSPIVRRTTESNSTSYLGVTKAALSIRQNLIMWGHFSNVSKRLDPDNKLVYWIEGIWKASKWIVETEKSDLRPTVQLGALAFKDESAGKVRVFAMVDCWTQWLLRPLHLRLFDVLGSLPTDGTKDQLRPIRFLLDKGLTRFWCYDLSAATDRLPVALQADILTHLMGDDFGDHWRDLLVNRPYYLPAINRENPRQFDEDYPSSVLYAVGQPMGALSSWAMLALTHHIMVALAARRAGFLVGSFRDYAVLGDDIVIANGKVAREYLIICREIGVKVGIHKSLISRNGCLEFAKRFFVSGVDASPISLLEIGAATRSLVAMLEIGKKYNLSLPNIVAILGYGYKVRGRLTKYITQLTPRIRHLSILYYSPWGVRPLQPNQWLNLRWVVNPMYDMVDTLHEGFETVLISRVRELRSRLNRLRPEMKKWTKDVGVIFYPSMQKWSKFYEVGSGILWTEINFVFRTIYQAIYKEFVDDHWDIDQKTYVIANKVNDEGEMGELQLDGSHLILYNELRHSLALLTRMQNPDERVSTKVVSHAHIWELWKGFPHYPRPSPPIMDGEFGFVMVGFKQQTECTKVLSQKTSI